MSEIQQQSGPRREQQPCSGLGWSWDERTRTTRLYFELLDEDGNDAGVGLKLGFEDMSKRLPNEEVEAIVEKMVANGFEGMPIRAVTPEDYQAAGHD